MKDIYLYGKHPVRELLVRYPERIRTLFLAQSAEQEFRPYAQRAQVRTEPLPRNQFMRDLEGAVHQGVVALVNANGLMNDYQEFMHKLEPTASTCLVLLNEITDPHNVGAIIRSAAAFGATAVLIPSQRQSPITGAVAKASAGMLFTIPLIGINNENQTILDLKERGYWVYGLAGEAKQELSKEKFTAPCVFVVGSEGVGLREKTREHCDILVRVPMHPRCESLNASVSAAVALSAWSSQHPEALV